MSLVELPGRFDWLKDSFEMFMGLVMAAIVLPIITIAALLTTRVDLYVWGCVVGALVGSYELYDVWIHVILDRKRRRFTR